MHVYYPFVIHLFLYRICHIIIIHPRIVSPLESCVWGSVTQHRPMVMPCSFRPQVRAILFRINKTDNMLSPSIRHRWQRLIYFQAFSLFYIIHKSDRYSNHWTNFDKNHNFNEVKSNFDFRTTIKNTKNQPTNVFDLKLYSQEFGSLPEKLQFICTITYIDLNCIQDVALWNTFNIQTTS